MKGTLQFYNSWLIFSEHNNPLISNYFLTNISWVSDRPVCGQTLSRMAECVILCGVAADCCEQHSPNTRSRPAPPLPNWPHFFASNEFVQDQVRKQPTILVRISEGLSTVLPAQHDPPYHHCLSSDDAGGWRRERAPHCCDGGGDCCSLRPPGMHLPANHWQLWQAGQNCQDTKQNSD